MNKKNYIFYFFLMPTGLLLLEGFVFGSKWCMQNKFCNTIKFSQIEEYFALSLFWLVIVTSVVLITLPLNLNVFNAWKKFTVFSIPAVLISSFFVSGMSDGGGLGVVGFPHQLFYIPIFFTYFLVSFTIIGVTWYRGRGTE